MSDVVEANVLTNIAAQCARKRVRKGERAIGNFVGQRCGAVAVDFELAGVGGDCDWPFLNFQLRSDVGKGIIRT